MAEGNIIVLSNALSWSRLDIACLAHHNPCEWIINSEADKHMTSYSKFFLTYTSCLTQDHVRIADGFYTPIAGTSSVNYTPSITLSSVLLC